MNLPKNSSLSPPGILVDFHSDRRCTEDAMLPDDDHNYRPMHNDPEGWTGNPQPSNGEHLYQHDLSHSARHLTFQGTGFGAISAGERAFSLSVDGSDSTIYPPSLDEVSLNIGNSLVDFFSSPAKDYVRSNAPSPPASCHGKRAYRSPMNSNYEGDSLFQFFDYESTALQFSSTSSPPPQSSSPLQSSPLSDDWWPSTSLATDAIDPNLEETSLTESDNVPLFSSTPDLSPDSPHSTASSHSTSSTFDKHLSKSSLTPGSSDSKSSSRSRSDSPDVAHTNTDYDVDYFPDKNDEFTTRLDELLLAVIRERERARERADEGSVDYNEDYFCRPTPDADSNFISGDTFPPFDSTDYELGPRKCWMSMLASSRMISDRCYVYARSPSSFTGDNHILSSATFTSSPTVCNPSAITSPLRESSLLCEEYQHDTELDTLVFASPSCSPPARTLKCPRSLSIDEADIDSPPFKCKLRKLESSITFSSTDSDDTPTSKLPAKTLQGSTAQYRVIKTPSTFLAERKLKQNNAYLEYDERPTKVRRIESYHDTSASGSRRNFATGPASLRRAASLRSDAEDESDNDESKTLTVQADVSRVPTVPSTPHAQVQDVRRASSRGHRRQVLRRQILEPALPPVPIIAPPPDHLPRLPLSEEATAKIRLRRLLEREKRAREADGLVDLYARVSTEHHRQGEDGSMSDDCDDGNTDDNFLHSPNDWEAILGVGEELRREVVQWILEVLPVYAPTARASSSSSGPSCTSSCSSSSFYSSSSSSSASTSTSSISASTDCNTKSNLLDQLSSSPETRFHAAYMLLRYFFLVFGGSSHNNAGAEAEQLFRRQRFSNKLGDDPVSSWELVTWDIGVACLALSVKFHRDFLSPLLPVYAYEFQALAPHALSYEELETSQRDILGAFSYGLGITPQAILDELWLALSSLRQLFSYDEGWNCVTKEAWWRLFEAVLEPDVLRFPISLLTVAALTDSIQASLIRKYEYEAKWNAEMSRRSRPRSGLKFGVEAESQVRAKRERRAEREAEGVLLDVQAVLMISDAKLQECRRWLREVLR